MHIGCVVRAIITDGVDLLLCKARDTGNLFLPGGHVNLGETAAQALVREFREETGRELYFNRRDPVMVFENSYRDEREGTDHHEWCLVFQAQVEGDEEVTSKEDHISFILFPWENLRNSQFLPAELTGNLRPYGWPFDTIWYSCMEAAVRNASQK